MLSDDLPEAACIVPIKTSNNNANVDTKTATTQLKANFEFSNINLPFSHT